MKAKAFKLTSLIVALLVAVFMTVGYAFAWFFDSKNADFNINGKSAGAYFDSGDGSKETPFVIANPTHMHNLAALQNTGKFATNGVQKQYYFEIKKTIDKIDMSTMYMPPVGNDEFPFIGVFNGNGKTVSNLTVTTDKDLLKDDYPTQSSDDYVFSRAVGLFGMTGKESDISNVILDNPTVDVAGTDRRTLYADAGEKVAGLAVGFVAGKCSSIGVRALNSGAALAVDMLEYSTFNSILGALGENVSSSVTGGGHVTGSGSSGSNFGANFDVDGMYERLTKIEANKKSSTPSWLLPSLGSSSSESITLGSLEKLPFTVTGESTYEGANAMEVVASNNIGYLLGNQNKVYRKTVTFGDLLTEQNDANKNWTYADGTNPSKGKIPRWIYTISGKDIASDSYNSTSGFAALTADEFDALPDGIKELVPATSGPVEGFTSIRMSQTYQNVGGQIYPGSTSNGQWSPHGQVSWNGNTYGEGFRGTTTTAPDNGKIQDAVDANGVRYTADGNYLDDNNYEYNDEGYFVLRNWPLTNSFNDEGYFTDNDGNILYDTEGDPIKRVGYQLGKDGSGFYLIKENGNTLYYNSNGGNVRIQPHTGTTVAYHRFTQGIALPNCGIWFKPIIAGKIKLVMYAETAGDGFALIKGHRTKATKENPLYVDYSTGGAGLSSQEVGKYTLPSNVLFYFEFDVSEEDIADGRYEYWLMQYGSGGAYFVYMDLGASAADDTSGIDREKAVSAVDFIYDGVEIKQGDPSQDAADALIKVGDFIVKTSGAEVNYDSSKTSVYFENITKIFKLVFVRLHNEEGNHSGKTICLEKSNPVPDKSSEVKATFATYVCPAISGGSGTVSGGGSGTVTPNPDPDPPAPELTLTLDSTAFNLTAGDTQKINATASISGATITYASDKPAIASVGNDGTVTANAAGEAVITVTATDGTNTVTKTVTVTVTAVVETTWINFDGTNVTSSDGSYFTTTTVAQGGNAGNVNGTAFSKGMKIDSAAQIGFTATGSVKLVIYMDAKKDQSISVDGTVYTATAYTENGSTNVVACTVELTAGAHTIKRGSKEAAIYRIEVIPI